MRTYAINNETAAGARSVGVSTRITEKGKYKGRFLVAEAVVSTQGTEGIEFRFKSDDGQTADYLTVWTHKKDGTELSGAKLVSAIMVCMQVRNCQPQRATVKKWDSTQRAEVQVDTNVFPEMMGKPIGLLLAREEYLKSNGDTDWKMQIAMPFDATTERTAAEVLDRKPASEALPKLVELLRDRPLKRKAGGNGSGGGGGTGEGQRQQTSFDDMDDDIPF